MDRDKVLFGLILVGVFLLGGLTVLLLMPTPEPVVYSNIAPMAPIHFEDKKECRYMDTSYYSSRVNDYDRDVDDARDDLDDAEDKLDYAMMTGNVDLIARAQHDVSEARSDLRDARDDLDRAKRDYNGYSRMMMFENC